MDNPKITLKELLGLLASYIFSILIIAILVGKINIELVYYVVILISSFISISSLLICMVSVDIGKGSIYSFISITFAFSGILKLISVFILLGHTYGSNSFNRGIQFCLMSSLIESASFIFLKVYTKKEINTKKQILFRLLLLIALIVTIDNSNITINIENPINITPTKIIIEILCAIFYLYSIVLINKGKKHILQRTRKDLNTYIVVKLIYLFVLIGRDICKFINIVIPMNIEHYIWYLVVLTTFVSSYYVFRICILDIIKRPNKTLYKYLVKEKNRLRESVYHLEMVRKDLECYNEKYEQLLLSLPDGVIMYEDKEIVFANNKISEFFNLDKPDELIGKSLDDIIDGGLEYNLYDLEPFEQNYSSKKRSDFVKYFDRKFCFKSVEFNGKITIFRKNIGESDIFIIIVINIDDTIRLKKIENELENKKIMEKAREEILSNISHDLKTPVNVIYSAIQMQELNIQMEKYKGIPELNLIIKQNCNRLLRLINNFIDSSKIESNNLKVNIKCINIVMLIEDITMSVLPFAQDKNLNLIFDTDDEEIYCDVDIDFIERIMLNLLSNAIKYNSENGSIDVFIENHSDFVSICVKDTGIGIPENKLSKLFKRFDRIDREPLRHKEGSGIGLNIVKSMIEKLDGSIEVISKENEGTVMIVNFPVSSNMEDEDIDLVQLDQKVLMELSDI